MNIFTAISQILEASVTSLVGACRVVNTTIDAADNVALMAKNTTASMLKEQEEEAAQALAELVAKRTK